ncbi:hypothetical protein [Clostridiisalibacter paucivorans]|uniref:hypothetical protein n=1 Tax=Clostridiisalibacter paucivorans TaxID=408753 RepID=UPI00047D19B8|nr:hypothetical protein [Clostridiisalibacter paucivorans]
MINILGDHIRDWENEREINYLIHRYSDVLLDKANSIDEIERRLNKNCDDEEFEIIEARFFNSKKELFIYKYEDDWNRILTLHGEDGKEEKREYFDREYLLEKKFKKKDKYNSIKVRKYVAYDDDLAYVKNTCLLDLVKGDKNG